MHVWDRSKAIVFAVSVCAAYWALSIVGSFGPQIKFAIPDLQFAIGSKFVLLMAATFLPAVFCVVVYPECRSSLLKFNASWALYLVAIAAGFLHRRTDLYGNRGMDFFSDRDTEKSRV
jgi:hypothetical protein